MYMKAKIVLTLTLFLLGLCSMSSAKVYLVSVGISDYPGTKQDLKLPVNDAKTISWLYSKNSNAIYKQLLNQQATAANILKALQETFKKAGTNDIVVFFFSGHGYPGGFSAYDKLLSYDKVRKAMAKSKCKNKMIFADACYAGKIRTPGKNSGNAIAAAQKANVMLFLSSRSDEVSIERRDMENGFFTTYLQRGLRGGADTNRDRIITAKELFNYVHAGVVKLSGDEQHPVMWGKFSDHMPVMVW